MTRPTRRWRGRLLLLLLACLFALGLGELAARLLLPGAPAPPVIILPGGEPVPAAEAAHMARRMAEYERTKNQGITAPHGLLQANSEVHFQYPNARWAYFDQDRSVSMKINSLGFRDLEFAAAKQPDELRILTLGDSFTLGQGVRLEDTWSQVLERQLRAARTTPVEVINGGFACGCHSPDGYQTWMAENGIRLAPDLVIVGLCLNDMGDVPLLSEPVLPPQTCCGSRLLGELLRQLELRRLRAQPRDLTPVVRDHPQMWQATQRALRELQALLAAHHVPLVIAILPMLSELERYPYAGLHAMVHEFCRDAGIRFVDLKSAFDGRIERDLWVDDTDQHPNDVGHRLIADGIHAYLLQQKLLP